MPPDGQARVVVLEVVGLRVGVALERRERAFADGDVARGVAGVDEVDGDAGVGGLELRHDDVGPEVEHVLVGRGVPVDPTGLGVGEARQQQDAGGAAGGQQEGTTFHFILPSDGRESPAAAFVVAWRRSSARDNRSVRRPPACERRRGIELAPQGLTTIFGTYNACTSRVHCMYTLRPRGRSVNEPRRGGPAGLQRSAGRREQRDPDGREGHAGERDRHAGARELAEGDGHALRLGLLDHDDAGEAAEEDACCWRSRCRARAPRRARRGRPIRRGRG